MNLSRYKPFLCAHYFFIIVDLFMNSFSMVLKLENVVLLVFYVFQDACIVFSIIIIFIMFFNTYVFQAGLVWKLVSKFKSAILTALVYLALSICFHVWYLKLKWPESNVTVWTPGLVALYVMHRTVATLYYYFCRSTMLTILDPAYYKHSSLQLTLTNRH